MWIRRATAIGLILVGLVWFFQGIGVIEGSFMTGEALWAVIGTVCVLTGVALLVMRPTRARRHCACVSPDRRPSPPTLGRLPGTWRGELSTSVELSDDRSPIAAPATSRELRHHPGVLRPPRGTRCSSCCSSTGSFSWATGGFLGVSLFFTLSGFLITRLLLADFRNHGRIRFAAFWERRALWLILAALVAVALVVVVAPYVWNNSQRSSLPGDVVSAVTYSANWHAARSGNSYGALFATPSPLEHYWSLVIEEQFYLVMPLLLAAVLTLSHGSRRGS